MTNNSICWIDNVYNTSDNIDYNKAHAFNPEISSTALDSSARRTRDQYLTSINRSVDFYKRSILSNARVAIVTKSGDLLHKSKQQLQVELPRELVLINPSFTLNTEQRPQENYLKGGFIHLTFDSPQGDWQQMPLYITSPYINYKVLIANDGSKQSIKAVETLGE